MPNLARTSCVGGWPPEHEAVGAPRTGCLPLELVSPVPPAWFPLWWGWLPECPSANLADDGPQTVDQFEAEMARRVPIERTWGVTLSGVPVGAASLRHRRVTSVQK
jgi:hypothetical protein